LGRGRLARARGRHLFVVFNDCDREAGGEEWGKGDVPPSIRARRLASMLKPPYLLKAFRSGVEGMELYFPGGKAHVHHC